jgi:hypothetical protein
VPRKLEGKSYAEIASSLDVTESGVETVPPLPIPVPVPPVTVAIRPAKLP